MNRERKQKTRADDVRAKVETLKSFDIVHELRGINMEQDIGCADALPLDMVVERLKPFHDALASTLDQLLMMVEDLETKTTGDYLLKQIIGDQERREPETSKAHGWEHTDAYLEKEKIRSRPGSAKL